VISETKIIVEDHGDLAGLFRFALEAIALGKVEEISSSLVQIESPDTNLVRKTLATLNDVAQSLVDPHLQHGVHEAARQIGELFEKHPERIQTPNGQAVINQRVELRNGSVVLRRGKIDPDRFSQSTIHLFETPSGRKCVHVNEVESESKTIQLLTRWLSDQKIEQRWKENVRNVSYDMSDSTAVPEGYRFKAPRRLGPISNLDGAYYLLEIAGTVREPTVIATYMIRSGSQIEAERAFFGPEIFDKVAEALIEKGYLKRETRSLDWTPKLRDELGQDKRDEYFGQFITAPHGEITELTDFKKWGDVEQILCSTQHRYPTYYAEDAAIWGHTHDLYHSLGAAIRGTR
jgi:hypothetical protein